MSKLGKVLQQLIYESDKHMTAEEIFLLCKEKELKISLASVYRVLNTLVDEGHIRKVSISDGSDVFDKSTEDHGHLVCSCCKKVTDVYIEDFKLILSQLTGKEVDSYHLNMEYICEECNSRKEKKNGKQIRRN